MIPFLGTYQHKITIGKDTCTLVFIAALFTIAKTWKQPECPSTDIDIENVVHTLNAILFSLKKEGNPAMCNNSDEP